MRAARSHAPSARLCAARAVQHVLRDQAQLETALLRQADYEALSARDRAFARLITATVFRRMGQIDAALSPFLKRQPASFPHAVLRTGAAQLLFLKTPVHAAVGESVALLKTSSKTRAYSGMVNAVLRKVSDQGATLVAATPPSANIPGWIRASWEKAYGKPVMRRMAAELLKEPPLDIHVKDGADAWAEKLGGDALSDWTVRLSRGGRVPELESFADGEWWIQDIAASLPVMALGDISGQTVLDMCAAPGGKTMQLAAKGAHVTALDKSAERLERVEENLSRTRLQADIIEADAVSWIAQTNRTFDLVLLDAPCSATGTYRRHPDVLYNRTPKDVGALARLQKKLIASAIKCVRPGGRLLYCSCSLQTEEGEAQAQYTRATFSEMKAVPFYNTGLGLQAECVDENGYLRMLPHLFGEKGGCDGFFAVLFKKEE